jgi:hypothetical protein
MKGKTAIRNVIRIAIGNAKARFHPLACGTNRRGRREKTKEGRKETKFFPALFSALSAFSAVKVFPTP